MRKIFLVLFLVSFVCCRKEISRNTIIISNIPPFKTIEGIDLKVPPILLNPMSFQVVDSFLIVAQKGTDTIFALFRLPDCMYTTSFGIRGRGPDEFMTSFPNTSLSSIHTGNGGFAVDNQMNNVQYYRINDILKKNFAPYKIVRLPEELNGFQAIRYVGDTLIIVAPYRGNMHLGKFNSRSKKMTLFKEYPKVFPFEDIEQLRSIYGCYMTINPNNQKFVLTYSNFGIIEIYKIDNNTPLTILYKGFPSLEDNLGLKSDSRSTIFNKNQMVFSWGITSTEKYIYVRIFNDIYDKISDGKRLRKSFIPEIHVFDWAGNFIVNIKLNKFYNYFDVNNDDKFLYAIDSDIENIIRRYDLTKILP